MNDGAIEAAFYQILGRKIEDKRHQRGLSQIDVARLLGVHRNTVSRWESGEYRIDAWQLQRLADVLSVNHLLLLPPREFTWGADLQRLMRERDAINLKATIAERDRALSKAEVA